MCSSMAMITVTKVRVTKDLSVARVYLSVFATSNKDSIMQEVKIHTKQIKSILALRIRNQVRKIPELEFFIDDSLDYIEKIDELLKS